METNSVNAQGDNQLNTKMKSKRNANIELLRIISMMMVITLHGLDKGDALVTMFGESGTAVCAWVIESFCIMAVNIYMLISGYFLVKCEFKSGRIIELMLQTLFYTFGIVMLLSVTGNLAIGSLSRYEWIQIIFPFHMGQYWFVSSYIIMYLFAPILAKAANNMTKKQLGLIILMLLAYESVVKSVLPIGMERDEKGYSAVWFMLVFLIAAYIRLYGIKLIKKPIAGLALYVVCVVAIFFENYYLQYRYSLAESFSYIQGISYHYNHILVILAAVGIFAFFLYSKPIEGVIAKLICFISPMSFGVYLAHEQIKVRFLWPEWLGIKDAVKADWSALLIKVVLAVLVVYIIGSVIDFIRIQIFKVGKFVVRRTPISTLLSYVDKMANGKI